LLPGAQTDIEPIRYEDGRVRYLDQRLLPGVERYVETADWRDVAGAIGTLAVRGAPLIGIAAAYGLALAARSGEMHEAARGLTSTRPTAVNLRWAIDRVVAASGGAADQVATVEAEALRLHQEQIESDERMSELGAGLLPDRATVLTHCNTGSLATGGIGTALGVIKTAHRQGKIARVLVDETRPLLQGSRLTARELERVGVRFDVIVDAAAAGIIAAGGVDAIVVGADRIAANGDTANKVGTYGLALAARAHDVPFYVVAPVSTIDAGTRTRAEITIEHRDEDEVLAFGGTRVATARASALNPAFDVTPHELVTAIVTERRVLRAPFVDAIASVVRPAAVAS
jgi:methylthioribose-1-phosphate isomerase